MTRLSAEKAFSRPNVSRYTAVWRFFWCFMHAGAITMDGVAGVWFKGRLSEVLFKRKKVLFSYGAQGIMYTKCITESVVASYVQIVYFR